MVEAVTRTLCRLPLLLALLAFPSAVFAHRLDEYLQATLVAIEPSGVRLQINLTPGVAVAEQVLALIDRDHDGVISKNEAAAYAELLKRDLTLRLDGRKLELKLTASEFSRLPNSAPAWESFRWNSPRSPARSRPVRTSSPSRTGIYHVSVYLINAAQPRSATVQITRQKRNENQSTGEIEFTFHPSRPKIVVSGARPKFGGSENKQDKLQFASDEDFFMEYFGTVIAGYSKRRPVRKPGMIHFLVNFRTVIAAVFGDLEKKRRRTVSHPVG